MTGPDQAPKGDAADGDSAEVLGKLEALLGRLNGSDPPAEIPALQTGIPTLTEPVNWSSPEPASAPVIDGGAIPTLTEPVELHGAPPAGTSSPAPSQEPSHEPAAEHPAMAMATVPATVPDIHELRAQVLSMLDPSLQSRLCERAIADLDSTLLDIQRDHQAELLAWRDDQAARIRDQVRGEIDRAVDSVVDALLRRRDPGGH